MSGPSPRISAKLNRPMYEDVCKRLDITPPLIVFLPGTRPGRGAYGDFNRLTNSIRIFLGIQQVEADGLRFATTEMVRTILHELRHAWQVKHSPNDIYISARCEPDAEGWAQAHVGEYYGLVRISRSYANSGFSRLSRHATLRSV